MAYCIFYGNIGFRERLGCKFAIIEKQNQLGSEPRILSCCFKQAESITVHICIDQDTST